MHVCLSVYMFCIGTITAAPTLQSQAMDASSSLLKRSHFIFSPRPFLILLKPPKKLTGHVNELRRRDALQRKPSRIIALCTAGEGRVMGVGGRWMGSKKPNLVLFHKGKMCQQN